MIEDQTNVESQIPQRRSWFLVAAFIAFIVIAVFSGYLRVKYGIVQKTVTELQAKKEELNSTLKIVSGTGTSSIDAALAIKDALQNIEAQKLAWSVILEKIDTTIPKLKATNESLVRIRSYNGASDGKLIINAATRNVAADPFGDIALAIHAFTQEPSFHNVFVPSITKSITPEGMTIFTFSINFEYQRPKF